jgi:DNA-binding transcriptional LysR family regulator
MSELDRERYCERVMCEFSTYIERLLHDRGVRLEVIQQSSREDWIQALVRANFGVAFMPISIAQAAGLTYVTMSDVPIVREVCIMSQTDRPTSAAQKAVVDSLLAYDWVDRCAKV